jgi:MFS family permease
MYAILSAGWVLPSLFAPAMSGWVVDAFGWRWVFLGIIPFAVAVAALAVRPMRQYGPTDTEARGTRMPQAVAAACGVGAFCTGVQVAQPAVAVAVTLAGVAVALPALRTLLPTGVGRAVPGLPAIAACRILATAAFLGADSFIPLAADRIHGARPLVQGFVIIGAAVSWTIGQWVRTKRPGRSPAAAVRTGFLVLCLGLVLCLPVLWQGWPLWATFLGWSVGGLGMGLLYNPSTVATMSYATPGNEGRTSSVISLSDALGFSVMGGIGGATVAVADRHGSGIPTAIGVNIALAIALTLVGAAASRRIRSASA